MKKGIAFCFFVCYNIPVIEYLPMTYAELDHIHRDRLPRSSGESLKWVPKVQGRRKLTESLRQEDRDRIPILCYAYSLEPLNFQRYFYFYFI